MKKLVFAGPAVVNFQGEEVLNLLDILPDHAFYRIIGFQKPVITITDRRSRGLEAVNHVINTGDVKQFADQFNHNADVELWESAHGDIHVILNETDIQTPPYMLWSAIGLEAAVPVYDYHYYTFNPISDDRYAFFSLYRRPQTRRKENYLAFSARVPR